MEDEDGDSDPLSGLKPLKESAVAALEKERGPLPADYRTLLMKIGVGVVLCAGEEEPSEYAILDPKQTSSCPSAAASMRSAPVAASPFSGSRNNARRASRYCWRRV